MGHKYVGDNYMGHSYIGDVDVRQDMDKEFGLSCGISLKAKAAQAITIQAMTA